MPQIKVNAEAEGGFFDPHTHFTGILPYRVLGVLTPDGKSLLGAWLKGDQGQIFQKITQSEAAGTLAIEDFLAHHDVQPPTGPRVHLDPPYKDKSPLSAPLYDLETRLMLLLHLSLRWGLQIAEAGDFVRMQENSATTVRLLTEGSALLQKYLPPPLHPHLKNISIGASLKAVDTLPPDKQAGELARLKKIQSLGVTDLPTPRPGDPDIIKIIDLIATFDYVEKSADPKDQYENGFPKLIRHLNQNVLTATPQNDYDSAYVARGLVTVSPADLLDAGMRELRRQNIAYSEQSVPLWTLTGKWKDSAPRIVKTWDDRGTVVRWLPMLVGSFLGWIGGDHEPVEAAERTMMRLRATVPDDADRPDPRERVGATLNCIARQLVAPYDEWMLRWAEPAPLSWPARTRETMLEDMATWIDRLRSALRSEVPYATGFDIASPERTWYTPHGTRYLTRLLRVVFEVAREQRRPLVAHIHVGEGYPAFASPLGDLQPWAKRAAQDPLRILYDSATGLPAHYLCGENNVEQAMRAVGTFRRSLSPEELAAFDRYVCVRFGHVTHASVIQAQQMADYRIWADVNLTSNLATGALTLPLEGLLLWDLAMQPANPGLLKQAREIVRAEENSRLFRHHALVTLLACGVPTVLGTDGGGVEHSDMAREYALASAVLEAARQRIQKGTFTVLSSAKRELEYVAGEAAAKELLAQLDPECLYRNQAAHHEWAQSWNEVPLAGQGLTAGHTALDAGLHDVFFSSLVPPRT